MIRPLQLLRDSADARQRTVFLACLALLGAIAGLVLGLSDKPDQGFFALFLVALGGWMLWAFWFSRVLLVVVQARELRVPLPWREAVLAWLCACVATVLVPALVLLAAGVGLADALLALAAAALGGLAFAFVPSWCAAFVGLLPMLNDRLDDAGIEIVDGGNAVAWIVLLALVVAWRGHVVVRDAARFATPSPSRPMLLALAQSSHRPAALLAMRDSSRHFAEMPRWAMDIGSTGGYGPRTPVAAMRAWLGSPFAPMRAWYRARQLAIVAGALALFPLLMADGSAQALRVSSLAWAAGFGGLMLALVFPARLAGMARRPAGEFAELALLPGFGGPDRARRTLLRAIAGPAGVAFGALFALVAGLATYAGIGVAGTAWLCIALGGCVLASTLGCLRPLAGRPLGPAWFAFGLMASIPLLVATGFAAMLAHRNGGSNLLPWVALAWVAVYAFLGQRVHAAWGWLKARPHPFLQR